MRITPFFRELRSAYQAEIEDLASDSEGKDVLRKRLAQKRKELPFLVKMLEISPEMVAVVFHQAFRFKSAAAMHELLGCESDEFPEWSRLAECIDLMPWARELEQTILEQPMGDWFMAVAAGLEFMYHTPERVQSASGGDPGDAEQVEDADADADADSDSDARSRKIDSDDDTDNIDDTDENGDPSEEAGADWLAEQGFDRKE